LDGKNYFKVKPGLPRLEGEFGWQKDWALKELFGGQGFLGRLKRFLGFKT